MTFFDYGIEDFVPCEVCTGRAVDIHHIEARGMGSSKNKDSISNLMALCRRCHEEMGDRVQFNDYLQVVHRKFMLKHAN